MSEHRSMCKYAAHLICSRLTCLLSPRRRFRPAQSLDRHEGSTHQRSVQITQPRGDDQNRISTSETSRTPWSAGTCGGAGGQTPLQAVRSLFSWWRCADGRDQVLMSQVRIWIPSGPSGSLQDPADPPTVRWETS